MLRMENFANFWRETPNAFVVNDAEWIMIEKEVRDLENHKMVQNVSNDNGNRSIVVPDIYKQIVFAQLHAFLGAPQS